MALTRLVNDYKDSVKVASTGANINLGAAPNTLDGVNLSLNDRVLLKDQSPTYLNGIYRVTTLGTGANGSWTRSSDFNDWREISPGALVFVETGTINGNAFFFINGGGSNVTIDSTAINFSNLYSVNGNVTSLPGNINVAGTLNVTSNITSRSSTQSTSTTTGAVVITGGIGVGSNAYIGGNLIVTGNLSVGGNTTFINTQTITTTDTIAAPAINAGTFGNAGAIFQGISQNLTGQSYAAGYLAIGGGQLTGYHTGAIGANTPNSGVFTSISTTTSGGNGNVSIGGNLTISPGGNLYLGSTAIGRYYGGNTSPSSPNLGDTWYQGNTDILYAYIQDANNNKYWLDLTSNPSSYGNLTVANTLTLNGTTNNYGTANLGALSQVIITGGTSGYVLRTDGNGGLSWVPVSATAGGSNTMVQFNDAGSIGGSTYLQYNKTSGNLVSNSTTTSTSTTTGAIVTTSLGVTGNVNANAYYSNYYLYSNGNPITTPAGGSNTMVQFNDSGTFTGATFLQYNKTSGNLVSNSTTAATSTTTGALVLSGGAAIGGALYANNFNGIAVYAGTIGNTSATFTGASATLSGALTLGGAINGQTINGTSILGTTIGNTASAVNGNLVTASAVYAGTIGNTGATHTGSTLTITGNTNLGLGGATNITRFGTYGTLLSTDTHVSHNMYWNGAWFYIATGVPSSSLRLGSSTSNNMDMLFAAANTNSWTTGHTFTSTSHVPGSNNTVSLGGASSQYFSAIYANNHYGSTFSGLSTSAKYADLAEMYHADDYYAPGTVMVFGGDLDVTNSKISHDPRVAGIVSTNPAYLMNDNFEQDNWLPIALTGRVPCLVQGPVQKGDLLVTGNHDGVAQKLDKSKYEVGCIIGKSLDIITDDSIRKIEVAVGRY